MPIYEYQCGECSHRLEKLQKISDDPLVDCPECGRPALTKLVSAAGFRLKGGGWYETDFKDKRKRNLAGDSEGGAGDGKRDAKADGKKDGSGTSSSGDGASDGKKSDSKKAEKSAPSTAA
jgi:putative FmdB family regulatory protein